jgi:hypothetical protein
VDIGLATVFLSVEVSVGHFSEISLIFRRGTVQAGSVQNERRFGDSSRKLKWHGHSFETGVVNRELSQ